MICGMASSALPALPKRLSKMTLYVSCAVFGLLAGLDLTLSKRLRTQHGTYIYRSALNLLSGVM